MNLNFDKQYEEICEGYNFKQIKEVKVKRFPRALKNQLSEQFIKSLRLEFQRLTSPVIEEDENGNESTIKPNPKHVMSALQKALPFLVR